MSNGVDWSAKGEALGRAHRAANVSRPVSRVIAQNRVYEALLAPLKWLVGWRLVRAENEAAEGYAKAWEGVQ